MDPDEMSANTDHRGDQQNVTMSKAQEDNELLPDDDGIKFEKDLVQIWIKLFCVLYFAVGIIYSMAITSYHLGSFTTKDYYGAINRGTCLTMLACLDSMFVGNIGLLVYNKYINVKYRNIIIEIPLENMNIFYTMILPLTVGSVCYYMIVTIRGHYNFIEYVSPVVEIIFSLAVVMLIIDVAGTANTGENRHLYITNIWAMFVTIIGVFNIGLIHFVDCGISSFQLITSRFYNISYYSARSNDSLYDILKFVEPLTVTWAVMVLCYLLSLFKGHILDIPEYIQMYLTGNDTADGSMCSEVLVNKGKEISNSSLVGGVIVFGLSLLDIPIYFAMKSNVKSVINQKCVFSTDIYSVILYSVPLSTVFIGLGFHLFLLKNMASWTYRKRRSLIHNTFIFIGFFAEFVNLLNMTMKSVTSLSNNDGGPHNDVLQGFRLTYCFLNVLSAVLQIIFMDISFSRLPSIDNFQGSMGKYNPLVIILCLNIGRCLSGILKLILIETECQKTVQMDLLFADLGLIDKELIAIYGMYTSLYYIALMHSIYCSVT